MGGGKRMINHEYDSCMFSFLFCLYFSFRRFCIGWCDENDEMPEAWIAVHRHAGNIIFTCRKLVRIFVTF